MKNKLKLRKEWEAKKNGKEWNNWKWQNANRITSAEQLNQIVHLSALEYNEIVEVLKTRNMSIPPNYALLIDSEKPLEDPIGKIMIPRSFMRVEEQPSNVFAHDQDIPVINGKPIIAVRDRYHYEILIRATWFCPNKCQFCYTGEDILEKNSNPIITREDIDSAIEYVRKVNGGDVDEIVLDSKKRPKTKIRDILISGGEIMGMANDYLEYILKELRNAGFKGVIRIGAKILATIPQRFNEETASMLAKYLPLQIDASIIHPKELTPELDKAVKILQTNCIMINSGTILLNGINNNEKIIEELLWGFHIRGIRPEYFYRVIGKYGQWARTKREEDFKLFEPFWNHKKVPGTVIPRLVDPTELGKVIYGSSTFKVESEKGLHKIYINGKTTLIKDQS